jgi:hypothetical protein
MQKQKPYDRNGKRVKVGDVVRIIGVPDLSGMTKRGRADAMLAFEHLVGKYKRIKSFDGYGCAEFAFVMKHDNGDRSWHSVWIEPFLLHMPVRRDKR